MAKRKANNAGTERVKAVGHAVICDAKACTPRDLFVRGDRVSFVSTEQAERVGIHPLDDAKMPSDIVLPKDYVIVNDPSGRYLRKCDYYVLPWSNIAPNGARLTTNVARMVADYFGEDANPQHGGVDIPDGKWHRVAQIAFIRYRREGDLRGNYEHPYNPAVWLYDTNKPLAWRIALPTGCVVDARGFVWP